jgi:hypothetical protein
VTVSPETTPDQAGGPGSRRQPDAAARTAAHVVGKHALTITLPGDLGVVRLPEPERLAFYGGISALAAFGILDWPVAVVLGIGHLLAEDHQHKVLSAFGEALADA